MRPQAIITFISLVALSIFNGVAAVDPTKTAACRTEICGSDFNHLAGRSPEVASEVLPRLTNAQRLIRGLSPNHPARHGRDSQGHRRNLPSPPVQAPHRGVIQVLRADNSQSLGYIAKNSFSGAQYRYMPDTANALIVGFSTDQGATSGTQLRVTAENSDTGFPIVGLITGRDNTNSIMSAGSFQYLYMGGTAATEPGATPQNVANSYTSATGLSRQAESDVWTIDLITGNMGLQWINPDGSAPVLDLFTQSTALYAGGSQAAFQSRYPSPTVAIKYKFISL